MTVEKPKRKSKRKNSQQSQPIILLVVVLAIGIAAGVVMLMFVQVEPTISPNVLLPDGNLLSNSTFEDNPFVDDSIWTVDERGTDVEVAWSDNYSLSGDFAVQLSASQGADQGWPGLTTTIQLTQGYDYVFSANAYSPDGGSAWLAVDLLDADGNFVRGYSTGCAEAQSGWHGKSYRLSASTYQDVAVSAIQFGLLQCLNYSEGTPTTLYYDDVSLVAELPSQSK